jgi:hypothetical protein
MKMSLQDKKCVMVIDENLPLGIIANTAAVLGITLGQKKPEIVGPDVIDQSSILHLGIVALPVPILTGNLESIRELRKKLYQSDFNDLVVVDFTDLAQGCKAYDEFTDKLSIVPESDLRYFGIAICGEKKKVNKLTGNMSLLR